VRVELGILNEFQPNSNLILALCRPQSAIIEVVVCGMPFALVPIRTSFEKEVVDR
jgi:hypothetical protein